MTKLTERKLQELENKFKEVCGVFKSASISAIYFAVLSDNVTEERELKAKVKDLDFTRITEEEAKVIIRALEREIKKYSPEDENKTPTIGVEAIKDDIIREAVEELSEQANKVFPKLNDYDYIKDNGFASKYINDIIKIGMEFDANGNKFINKLSAAISITNKLLEDTKIEIGIDEAEDESFDHPHKCDRCIFEDTHISFTDAEKMCNGNKDLALAASELLKYVYTNTDENSFNIAVSMLVEAVTEINKENISIDKNNAKFILLNRLDAKLNYTNTDINKNLEIKAVDQSKRFAKVLSEVQIEVKDAALELLNFSIDKLDIKSTVEFIDMVLDAAEIINKNCYTDAGIDRAALDLTYAIEYIINKKHNNSVDNVKEKIENKKAIASSIVNNPIITEAVLDLISMATIQFRSLDVLNDFIEDISKAAKYICNNIDDMPKTVSEAKGKLLTVILNRSYDKIR